MSSAGKRPHTADMILYLRLLQPFNTFVCFIWKNTIKHHFPLYSFIINLWQLCLPLFSVISTFMSYSVCLDKKRPLISGPHWGNFNFWSSSPSSLRKARQPSSDKVLNSNRAAIMKFEWVVTSAVGPNLPLNWWNMLYKIVFTSCSKCPPLIHKIERCGSFQSKRHK